MISREPDKTLQMPFVLIALERALAQAVPKSWNGDRGSRLTSLQYVERLRAAQGQVNMDGRGRSLDNIFERQ